MQAESFATKVDVFATKADVAATRADLAKMESRLIKWMVAMQLITIGTMSAIMATLIQLLG